MATTYDLFKPVVEGVLNNWTALLLAVEHGMGGPNSKAAAIQLVDYVTRYCCENTIVEVEDLVEVLEDIMDEEFDTVCDDNSPNEIARLLVRLLSLFKKDQHEELNAELKKLSKCQLWLSQPQAPKFQDVNDSDSDSSSGSEQEAQNGNNIAGIEKREPTQHDKNTDESMEIDADPGWTVVKTRKKKH